MAFCSFSGEYEKSNVIALNSKFITEYLPEASGDSVRVYLYGLFACSSTNDLQLEDMASALDMDKNEIIDCFRFWEEYDLVAIISESPFSVRYLPVSQTSKPRKFKPEKYGEFSAAIQALMPERMISTSEYTAYFNFMEEYSIKPEAMLMICKYCVDIKGNTIGYRYIIAVAKDFAYRGIVTTELIEKELNDYVTRSSDISAILAALGVKRKPEIEDLQLFNKWRKELGYEQPVLLYAAKKCKRKNTKALDDFVLELYGNKIFTSDEIDKYLKQRDGYRDIAKNVCHNLSVYIEVLDTVVENYITHWLAKGYDSDTLEFLANYCFKKNKRSLADMNYLIETLYDKGLVTLSSIAEYVKRGAKTDEFIRQMLSVCGLDRRPTESDRNTLSVWQNWGFSDEMILEACKRAAGSSRPLIYVNAILSNWKSKDIFTADKLIDNRDENQSGGAAFGDFSNKAKGSIAANGKTQHFANERNYSKADLDALLKNVDDIDF